MVRSVISSTISDHLERHLRFHHDLVGSYQRPSWGANNRLVLFGRISKSIQKCSEGIACNRSAEPLGLSSGQSPRLPYPDAVWIVRKLRYVLGLGNPRHGHRFVREP